MSDSEKRASDAGSALDTDGRATKRTRLSPSLSSNPYAMYLTQKPTDAPITNPYYYLMPGPNPLSAPVPPAPNPKLKRPKSHSVKTKSHSIPPIPRDPQSHLPILPLNVGIMTVYHLGTICTRPGFHTERYIFPIGYSVSRRYLSTLSPTQTTTYTCTILDGIDGPKFQVVPQDNPKLGTVIAGTATGAWAGIVKSANKIRNRQHSNSVSGPDFFGLGQGVIRCLIQELKGADRLAAGASVPTSSTSAAESNSYSTVTLSQGSTSAVAATSGTSTSISPLAAPAVYVWQHYIEGGPLGGRHAAVTPVLPEEDIRARVHRMSAPGAIMMMPEKDVHHDVRMMTRFGEGIPTPSVGVGSPIQSHSHDGNSPRDGDEVTTSADGSVRENTIPVPAPAPSLDAIASSNSTTSVQANGAGANTGSGGDRGGSELARIGTEAGVTCDIGVDGVAVNGNYLDSTSASAPA